MADGRTIETAVERDRDLALRAGAGCREAFATLLEHNYERIHRLAWRFCGRTALAEDIAQDVCVKLARVISGYRGEAAFSTWLYRITFTTASDHLRAGRRVQAVAPAQALALVEQTGERPTPTPEDIVIGAELWDAVRNLSPKQRDAVLLVYGEDMSHGEAALILECSEKTVSWHLFEAKKRLRVTLEAAG